MVLQEPGRSAKSKSLAKTGSISCIQQHTARGKPSEAAAVAERYTREEGLSETCAVLQSQMLPLRTLSGEPNGDPTVSQFVAVVAGSRRLLSSMCRQEEESSITTPGSAPAHQDGGTYLGVTAMRSSRRTASNDGVHGTNTSLNS